MESDERAATDPIRRDLIMNDAQGVLVGRRWNGQGYRQALWWVRYPTAPTAKDGEAVRAAAAELADRLPRDPPGGVAVRRP
ncbi:hypothetical protein SAMN05660657_05357 [Geodermatophilus amargosae]|uniref:Uncharacterized protein n=1 Tax=Geodermatophilus amargosae TaxID=1296565 RepID=A0A1I7D683_9ACTN|nr:hypothetical protein SAMN05660657_05357 [Geodermatophilus amargosae]